MNEKSHVIFELLHLELDDLYEDLKLVLDSLEERHRSQVLTDRVYEENAATLRAEIEGVKSLLHDIEAQAQQDSTAEVDFAALSASIDRTLTDHDLPRALEHLVNKKLKKIQNYFQDREGTDFSHWHFQYNTPHTVFGFEVIENLFEARSPFQKVAVVATLDYGRVLLIDDLIMVTEKDAFVYHEMMVHVPLSVCPDARDVLVIGGGDGGTVTELCRYPQLQRIVEVEIDEVVVNAARQYFPELSRGYADPRVELLIEDGVRYMAQAPEASFDVILIDSTDPIGPGEGLFSQRFYQDCRRVLKPGGVLINQSESPYYPKQARELQRAAAKLRSVFKHHSVYQMFIPTYESGHWLLGFASDSRHPMEFDPERWQNLAIKTHYYTPDVHRASFALPPFVSDLLENSNDH